MPFEQLIYTDRPRGKGLEPGAAGYQIQACSAGLGPELRNLLGDVCRHYGDAVYRHAPQAAAERETAWRATAESLAEVPAEVLAAFPVVWSYDRLADDLYALTRVRYAGFTYDGRTGNFFAHSLVFTPGDLASCGGNPLALARSGLFLSSSPGDGTSLPAVEGPNGTGEARREVSWDLYRERLPALVASLAATSGPPVLLGLAEWSEAVALVEALLELLPPSARSRTTFCTYESDRNWEPPAGHHLLVLCPRDGRPLDLRPDEYRSRFAVFNFLEGRFSDAAAPGPYARLAAGCAAGGDLRPLQSHHALLEALGLDREPAAWDALAPAAALGDEAPHRERLAEAARVLLAAAREPAQRDVVLERLLPRVRRLDGLSEKPKAPAGGAGLRELAALCPVCGDNEAMAADLLRIAGWIEEPRARAEALGWMAEAAYGTVPGRRFLAAYREETADETVRRRVRQRLIEGGAVRVPSREMLDESLPGTREDDRHETLAPGWEATLDAHPALLDQACRETAAELATADRPRAILRLAKALLAKQRARPARPAAAELAGAAVLALPMAPLTRAWSQALPLPAADAPPAVGSRSRVLRLLQGLEQRAGDPAWSARHLPDRDPDWQTIAALEPADREAALDWCLGTLREIGVTTQDEAAALVRAFRAAGAASPEEMARAVIRLVDGRDRVSCVQVAAAFARCALEGTRTDGYGAIVGALLERCGKPVRELFEEHLAYGFGRRGPEREERLRELFEDAGLVQPRADARPSRTLPVAAAKDAPEPGLISGAIGRARGLLGRLLGEPQPEARGRRDRS
jgi:hypothetical protein